MLSLRIRLEDLKSANWRWSTDQWTNGASWIKPVASSVLTRTLVNNHGHRCTVTVEERKAGERDFTTVAMEQGRVRLSAGVFGTAPLYLMAVGDELHGAWDLAQLRPYLRTGRVVPRTVARILTRQHRYTTDTLFEGVYRLTERATAVFTASGLTVRYPEPAEHVLEPRTLRLGVDPVDVFSSLLSEAVRETPTATECVGIELSGGADSGNVALSVRAARCNRVYSFGLVMSGSMGAQQRERRRRFVDHCGFRDTAIPAMQHPPFVPGGVRALGKPHDPAGAFYQEAFDVLRAQAAARGCDVIFTGNGGDEINAHHSRTSAELPMTEPVPWLGSKAKQALADVDEQLAPIPVLPIPALMAFGLHNPGFLRVGVWPVSPLVHPRIVRFMEQLPHEHKRGKAMFRERLRRAGLPESVASPAEPENFLEVMETGLRTFGLPTLDSMLRESLLGDLGYVDPKALAQAREDAERTPVVPDLLCDVLALEVGLRALT
ncbi:asparagine synthase-related protein [Streptomyces sp. XD-27]|uniref:asparagine synthase-related protein n=1 Tax=Streptomyces sp. XD-27 TaxID=3062779 RepID=UPI0026F46322|nr:asparagine synthase-related protein [Streptomyces sp. XD-27]WKX70537.1 asparagine synthase-related protein [Streptomyces sp. XD-27]